MARRRKSGFAGWLALLAAIASATLVIAIIRRQRASNGVGPPLPKDCPIKDPRHGIDVSYYQGEISWPRVKRAGVEFAFIRVADGTEIIDPMFEANWGAAQNAGIPRGAYQYFRADQSPTDQADVLIAMLRSHGKGELPPVIDVEDTAGLPLATVAQNARAWIERVRTELKVEPIVYTNPGMWVTRGAPEIASQTLWLAHYTTGCPEIPSPWKSWKFWQYTDNGRVDGIDGVVDLDVLDGPLPRR
jgi:lysozyme